MMQALLYCFTGNCVAFPIKQKALRVDRTAAEQNLSLREPPQAENPALQDSIFLLSKSAIFLFSKEKVRVFIPAIQSEHSLLPDHQSGCFVRCRNGW